jgi:hypothetical protein
LRKKIQIISIKTPLPVLAAKLVRELGAGRGEWGAEKKRAGSRDCCQNFQNKGISQKIEIFIIDFF